MDMTLVSEHYTDTVTDSLTKVILHYLKSKRLHRLEQYHVSGMHRKTTRAYIINSQTVLLERLCFRVNVFIYKMFSIIHNN